MYGNTIKQMKVKWIVCFFLSIPFAIFSLIMNLNNGFSLLAILGIAFLMMVTFPIQFMALILNWKKILWGFIRPIPILSYIIEWFKAYIMSFKALIWTVMHWKDDE